LLYNTRLASREPQHQGEQLACPLARGIFDLWEEDGIGQEPGFGAWTVSNTPCQVEMNGEAQKGERGGICDGANDILHDTGHDEWDAEHE